MSKRLLPLFILLLISTFISEVKASFAAGDTVYVDLGASGANNGLSWANAYTDLQNAIGSEPDNKIFLVAKGTYYPANIPNPGATFGPKNGQQLWGGFPSGGADFSLRSATTNVTILSGDLNINGTRDAGLDANTVLTFSALTGTVILDGFTITGGINAGGQGGGIYIQNTSVAISNNTIENNSAIDGAGIYSICFNQIPRIFKNRIRSNSSLSNGKGGGLHIDGPAHVYSNIISKNFADNGGGMYVMENGFSALFVNNTIANNRGSFKGILYQVASGGSAKFHNNIVWNNEFTFTADGSVFTPPQPADVRNSISQEVTLNTNGNKTTDPLFTDTTSGNFTLKKCSPAIESGDSLLLAAVTTDTTDFLGQSRYFDADFTGTNILDMGVFESRIICEPCTTNAGPDAGVCGLSYTLGAKKPGFERSGKWTKVSGPGTVSYDYDTLQTALVTVSLKGTYTFRWTMTGTDCSIADDVKITFDIAPVSNAGADASVCGKTTTLAATLSSGTGNWTALEGGVFIANNTQSNTSITVPGYGPYRFVWTESSGACPTSTDTVIITAYNQPIANAGADSVACSLSTNLKAFPSLGTGTWSQQSGPGTSTFANLNDPNSSVSATAYGNYNYRWMEVNGNCPSSSNIVVITYKAQPVANAGSNIDTCGLTAQLRAVPSAGSGIWSAISGPGSVSFNQDNNPNTTAIASVIGQYTLRWTETNGPACSSSSDDIIVNLTQATLVTLEYINDRYCDVNEEVFFGINIAGTAPFTFVVNSQHRSDTITSFNNYYLYSDQGTTKGQSQLTFQITQFSDGSGCPGVITNNLIVIPRKGTDMLPVGDGFTVTNDTLCASNTVVIGLNYNNAEDLIFYIEDVAKGNIFPVSYQGGIVNVPVSNLQYGVNKLRINSVARVNGGCNMIPAGVQEINVIYKPVQFTLVGQNLTCFGSTDGSLAITTPAGQAGFTSATINGVSSPDLLSTQYQFNLTAGSYVVKITNIAGCEQTKSVIITQPSKIAYTQVLKNPTCYGFENGSVDIQTSGGSGALTIYFNGFSAPGPFKFINQSAGTYGLKITDNNNGCILFGDSITLTQPDSLVVTTVSVDVNCDGTDNGNITITGNGGTFPYTATVTLGSFQQSLSSFSPSVNVGLLKQGVYTIRVIDNQGCITTVKDSIGQGVELVYTAVKRKDQDCLSGGIIAISELADVPGTLYSIDGINYSTDTLYDNLTPGQYVVSAMTPAGCFRNFTLTILDKNLPFIATIVELNSPSCFNGKDGKISISIAGGSGNYRVVADGGAPVTDTIFDNLSPGTHTFTVIDLSCALIIPLNYDLANPAPYTIFVSTINEPTCSYSTDGLIRVFPNGGNPGNFQYSIDSGSTFQFGNQFTNLRGGTYSIVTKDGKGCISTAVEFGLQAPDSLAISVNFVNDFVSRTSDITITATGGTPQYFYTIDGIEFFTSNVFNDVPFAYIIAQVRDDKGCRNSKTIALGDVGIYVNAAQIGITAYPNPSYGELTFQIPGNTILQEITVTNSIGQVAMVIPGASIQNGTIDLSKLSKGLYHLVVKTNTSVGQLTVELLD